MARTPRMTVHSCPPDDGLLPTMQRPRCCARHQQQYAALTQALQQPQPCLVCGAWRVATTGVFLPDDPPAWGGNATQHRLFVYTLCDHCASRGQAMVAATLARLRHRVHRETSL